MECKQVMLGRWFVNAAQGRIIATVITVRRPVGWFGTTKTASGRSRCASESAIIALPILSFVATPHQRENIVATSATEKANEVRDIIGGKRFQRLFVEGENLLNISPRSYRQESPSAFAFLAARGTTGGEATMWDTKVSMTG